MSWLGNQSPSERAVFWRALDRLDYWLMQARLWVGARCSTQSRKRTDWPPQRDCERTDQRELVRHYTLSAAELAAIRRCRGDHNRLGHALMLCYLRYPGRPLKAGERPPRSSSLFIAEQIDALPELIEDYLAAERNRQRHVAELQDRLGFRPLGTRRGRGSGCSQRVEPAC